MMNIPSKAIYITLKISNDQFWGLEFYVVAVACLHSYLLSQKSRYHLRKLKAYSGRSVSPYGKNICEQIQINKFCFTLHLHEREIYDSIKVKIKQPIAAILNSIH